MNDRPQGFIGDLDLRDIGAPWWRVLSRFGYQPKNGETIWVLPGFDTDLTSVPRLFWVLFPRDGAYRKAAVIHDWLYDSQEMSRYDADIMFCEIMEYQRINRTTRYTMFLMLRSFGWLAWNRHKKRKK